jgi:hypothetical protein
MDCIRAVCRQPNVRRIMSVVGIGMGRNGTFELLHRNAVPKLDQGRVFGAWRHQNIGAGLRAASRSRTRLSRVSTVGFATRS